MNMFTKKDEDFLSYNNFWSTPEKEEEHKKELHGEWVKSLSTIKVTIASLAQQQIDYYVANAPGEISGLGRCVLTAYGYHITKVYLLDQENTGASTDICSKATAKLMYSSREDEGELNFWWHSHSTMGVFWSGTDMHTLDELATNNYILAAVFNKARASKVCYYQKHEGLPTIFLDDLALSVATIVAEDVVATWDAELKTKCKAKSYAPPKKIPPLGEPLEATVQEQLLGFLEDWFEVSNVPVGRRRSKIRVLRECSIPEKLQAFYWNQYHNYVGAVPTTATCLDEFYYTLDDFYSTFTEGRLVAVPLTHTVKPTFHTKPKIKKANKQMVNGVAAKKTLATLNNLKRKTK